MMKYRYLIVMFLGAILGILQGIGNAKSERLAIAFADSPPIMVYVFFGGAGILGVFLKLPKKNELFMAFACSVIVFSGCVTFLIWLNNDLTELLGIMSISAVGLGSGMFFRTAKLAYLEITKKET